MEKKRNLNFEVNSSQSGRKKKHIVQNNEKGKKRTCH